MTTPRRSRSVVLAFAAALVTFLFTFANVSCQGQRVASLSGVQLAFGTSVSRSDMWGNKQQNKVPAEPLALYALMATAAGAGLALIGPAARRFTALMGGTGALLLMILVNKLDRDATLQSSGMLDVSPGFGLISAIGLLLIAGAVAWFTGRDRRTDAARAPDKLPQAT